MKDSPISIVCFLGNHILATGGILNKEASEVRASGNNDWGDGNAHVAYRLREYRYARYCHDGIWRPGGFAPYGYSGTRTGT